MTTRLAAGHTAATGDKRYDKHITPINRSRCQDVKIQDGPNKPEQRTPRYPGYHMRIIYCCMPLGAGGRGQGAL